MVELANTLAAPALPRLHAKVKNNSIEIPRNPLFSSLTRQQIRLILPHIKFKRLKPGREILSEGQRNPGKLFIVIEGQVAATKLGLSPIEGQPTSYEIGLMRRGDLFGELSFVDGKPSALSFTATVEATVAVLDLSGSARRRTTRRLREIVTSKLRHHMARHADESVSLRVSTLQLENEFSAYRNGVGHIVVTTLCLLSCYTLTLSFLPGFKSLAHANFALSPLIILLFSLSFIPIIATSGFPLSFFGLQLRNWRPALAYSLRMSLLFIVFFIGIKWVLIHTTESFADVSLIDGANVQVGGQTETDSAWYWIALTVYLLLTPMQEFVARSGIQAPLYAFLHGSEFKRRWASILASNLVFAAAHAHISLAFALAAFLPGMLWGWIFARTNSLMAATVSHILIGGSGMFLFGVETMVERLSP
ncbi:type II CAAX prenyl endopeptidase Rce1 family protein [Rhodomicrobium sp. Az07]|uniref:CPBP family glutamic-type intramembrane protease n=1 Tax=Rhodomicrobium sp. Az07 TaxID=2839034 RepID=UPI002037397E|nr:CPBP family glutamic-type intramembrane protease [Rhodomicrobium sp. Az07]